MPVNKSDVRKAAGKLVSAIQKEWGDELGELGAPESEEVMNSCHELLAANSSTELTNILHGRSVTEFLGLHWVRAHPAVLPYIEKLEAAR